MSCSTKAVSGVESPFHGWVAVVRGSSTPGARRVSSRALFQLSWGGTVWELDGVTGAGVQGHARTARAGYVPDRDGCVRPLVTAAADGSGALGGALWEHQRGAEHGGDHAITRSRVTTLPRGMVGKS